MFLFTTWALRWFGISGILGGLLFISGDLLYNYVPGSTASPAMKMSKHPQNRLIAAGIMGLLGCWLYALGSMHLYLAFRPAGEIFAFISLIAFGAVMICYGVSHAAYFAIAAGARVAAMAGSDVETGGALGNAFYKKLVSITYVPVGISSLLMLYGIVSGRSMYPRWMVIFLPLIIYFLKAPILRILRGHVREIVNDAYDNIVVLLFFFMSTLILWNGLPS